MSYCTKEGIYQDENDFESFANLFECLDNGKDKVMFLSKDELSSPSTVKQKQDEGFDPWDQHGTFRQHKSTLIFFFFFLLKVSSYPTVRSIGIVHVSVEWLPGPAVMPFVERLVVFIIVIRNKRVRNAFPNSLH